MRVTVRAFWLGAAVSAGVFMLTGSTTVDLDATAGASDALVVTGRVDQGPLSRLLSPAVTTLGTARLTKRSWGFMTTYREEITVVAARLSQQAGTPLRVRVQMQLPGTIVGTNATSREDRTFVWTDIPSDDTLWAQTRAVNWPLALFFAAAIALSIWLRPR